MADDRNNNNDDFVDLTDDDSYDEDDDLGGQDEFDEDQDEDVVDLTEDDDEEAGDVAQMNLAGAGLDHTISDEAGTRLSLTDIHGGTLKPTDMATEMKQSFLEYSMSVIVARALPDVRDGLKPVQRRILYAMNEAHIVPSRPHKKSAWTVGEVMGKYHPHGDASIYDAMVRLAQDFSMRLALIDGHGNFGSIDGDPPAAMRYTESRLTYAAMEMLRDMEKETVDLQPNYDESLQEPAVLPARFPNLLVNGSQGIAVGMATNVPPHNLAEVTKAVCMMIDNPDATTDDLMRVLPGPDFPTGGIIMGTDGIREAYETCVPRSMWSSARTAASAWSSRRSPTRSTRAPSRSASPSRSTRSTSRASRTCATSPTARACASSSTSSRAPCPRWSSTTSTSAPSCSPTST